VADYTQNDFFTGPAAYPYQQQQQQQQQQQTNQQYSQNSNLLTLLRNTHFSAYNQPLQYSFTPFMSQNRAQSGYNGVPQIQNLYNSQKMQSDAFNQHLFMPQPLQFQSSQSYQAYMPGQNRPSFKISQAIPDANELLSSYNNYNNNKDTEPIKYPSDTCGIVKPKLGNYVANGEPTADYDWPWHCQLIIAGNNRSESETYCGATLIHKRFILTAAHCYDDLLQSKWAKNTIAVFRGVDYIYKKSHSNSNYKQQKQNNGIRLKISKVIIHPDYVPAMTEADAKKIGKKPGPHADIALLELKVDTQELYKSLMPICLPEENYQLNIGTKCKIMGHGFMSARDEDNFAMPSILQMADVCISTNEDCRNEVESLAIKSKINEDTVCIRGPIHPCVGDSGGPLLCQGKGINRITGAYNDQDDYDDDDVYNTKPTNDGKQWYLTGVTSFAVSTDEYDKCGQFKSAVFGKVSHYVKWIYSIIKNHKQ